MRRVLAVLTISLLTLTVFAPSAEAGACVPDVEIADGSYMPAGLTKTMPTFGGPAFCWHNGGSQSHTVTSDDGFFDSGTIAAGGSYGTSVAGSGAYPYHCAIHLGMQGTVRVRPRASDTSVIVGTQVTLRVGNAETKGYNWDVQRKRGNGEWVTIKTEVGPNVVVTPSRAGTLRFRARTRNFGTGDLSGWSPPRRVIVTAD